MSEIKYKYTNLDKTEAFSKLQKTVKPSLKELLTVDRIKECSIQAGAGLTYNYSAKAVSEETVDTLAELALEQELIQKYMAVLSGERMNTGEDRKVLHQLTRGQCIAPVTENGTDIGAFYAEQRQRIADFSDKVHRGEIKGSTGKQFDTVVQIGIGGSDLGPRALYIALEGWAEVNSKSMMDALFISNVDPDDATAVAASIDPETTLFILVSKSGTTQETLTNQAFVLDIIGKTGPAGLVPAKHMIAVTSATSPLAKSDNFLDSFYIDDYIGGRYSSTSAVGGAVLSLAFGPDVFDALLAGAHDADMRALEADIRMNAALMDAMIGLYERNVLGFPSTAVLPYSQCLSRFPAHLQQLDMESNGKSVNRDGEPVNYATGPTIFGEPGTNGQHSFYQLLHQGTDIVPLQFVGFENSQRGFDLNIDGSSSQTKLNANLAAQITAFALGSDNSNPNKQFNGERPSSLIHGSDLNPEALGALLAHFENKVMFQGFAWNINSFDQEGVQLGKLLTKKLLGDAGDEDTSILQAYFELLNK
ncbi:MAG: glucose-6-phosphate isomerase [Spirochaetales bacterium]|uniref:Glucose-6-phosphate isomerase n=1 Tax=Candidatus Thalassospirochaeta sargassi TaxID=3119039 RepID=A0AAJ1MK01_9SPIO|nr:glucose-6-phosphate isomerase [Spirochaetales bacterium]